LRAAKAVTAGRLPPLAPIRELSRRLSTPEYYHAAIGASSHTLDGPRYTATFIHGKGNLPPEQWQQALDRVAAVNPGVRLRMVGHLRWARWKSDGPGPRLRMIDDCAWDLRSEQGSEFIDATPLSLREGPAFELIVARLRDGSTLVVGRSHHAFADGMGLAHIMEELFRALRGEPLLGSNASFSDVDMMLAIGPRHSTSRHIKTTWLTGPPAGTEMGDEWRRISLGVKAKNLARVAGVMAEFAHQRSDMPVLLAIPVNLRRHVPGLLATTNFSKMLLVPLNRGEGAEQFSRHVKNLLKQRIDTFYPRIFEIARMVPFSWLDRILSRTPGNYSTRPPMETAVINFVSGLDLAKASCPGFRAECAWARPLSGSVFSTLVCLDDRVEMTINLPRVLSSNGRFDELVAHLQQRLGD
jgi:hypothetical protein